MFPDDHEGKFPARITANSGIGAWPTQLREYYHDLKLLLCASDRANPATIVGSLEADSAPRSYIINGWNDYFQATMTNVTAGNLGPITGAAMPESAIKEPSETILFGEKESNSQHYYMDFLETASGNDFTELEHGRHSSNGKPGGGMSDYAFADGSARPLPYWRSVSPINLWAVTETWRKNVAGQPGS